MKLWGERLKMLRLEHGMTQQALADKLCTERTTIAGWELKGKEPDFQLVVDIADVFNVSPALTNQTDILQCVLLSSFTYYYQYLPELFSVNV